MSQLTSDRLTPEQRAYIETLRGHILPRLPSCEPDTPELCVAIFDALTAEVTALRARLERRTTALRNYLDTHDNSQAQLADPGETRPCICFSCKEARRALDDGTETQ